MNDPWLQAQVDIGTAELEEQAPLPAGCRRWHDLLAAAAASCPGASARPDAVQTILYTSGTTGPPKGAMLSHHAYLNSARCFAEQMVGATGDDVLYTCLPLFHINAQAHTVLPAIDQNATMAIGDAFSASRFWDEIRHHGATIFNSLAAMIPILCKQPPGPGDRDHRARLTACAATPKDVWLQFEERFGVRIVEGYGLTETTGFCVTNPRDAVRVGSIGRAMDFVDALVVDGQDRAVESGHSGDGRPVPAPEVPDPGNPRHDRQHEGPGRSPVPEDPRVPRRGDELTPEDRSKGPGRP